MLQKYIGSTKLSICWETNAVSRPGDHKYLGQYIIVYYRGGVNVCMSVNKDGAGNLSNMSSGMLMASVCKLKGRDTCLFLDSEFLYAN